jgi:2-polyprenyl-3-methyl-5-hydroxy-6-metoxy-1,4-benzoquinol methylase
MRVLDVGCGVADFAREARREGARLVVGIDPSHMLERAIALTQYPAIEYRCASIEELDVGVNGSTLSCRRGR